MYIIVYFKCTFQHGIGENHRLEILYIDYENPCSSTCPLEFTHIIHSMEFSKTKIQISGTQIRH